MPDNKGSISLGEEIWDCVKKWFNKLATYTNADLKENLGAKTINVKPSKQQEELLKGYGEICDAIGSKLVVVRNNEGCMLFKLTEEDGIEQIDFGNVDFIAKNISRVFKELFVIEGENEIKVIKFNPDTDEQWKSFGIFKRYEKGWRDSRNRQIPWVRFYTDDGHSETEFSYEHGWDIPNFNLILNK